MRTQIFSVPKKFVALLTFSSDVRRLEKPNGDECRLFPMQQKKNFKEHVLKFELLQTTAGSDHVPSVLTLNANVFTHIELGLERPPYILNAPHLQTRPSSPNMHALVYEARSPLQRSCVAYLRT